MNAASYISAKMKFQGKAAMVTIAVASFVIIIAVAVSDNGKRAAVIAVGAENGELYCKVHIFDFSYSLFRCA